MTAAPDLPHVLIVDDNLDAGEVLALLIESEGFSAAAASSLAEGREQIARKRPRLVFLDLNLPDGSGMSLLAELNAGQGAAPIDAVMLSGSMDDKIRAQAEQLGAMAVLVKPLDAERLTALLDAVR